MHLHQVGVVGVITPHRIEDLVALTIRPALFDQQPKEPQFGCGQVQRLPPARAATGLHIRIRSPTWTALGSGPGGATRRRPATPVRRLEGLTTSRRPRRPVGATGRQAVASGDQHDADVALFADDVDEVESSRPGSITSSTTRSGRSPASTSSNPFPSQRPSVWSPTSVNASLTISRRVSESPTTSTRGVPTLKRPARPPAARRAIRHGSHCRRRI